LKFARGTDSSISDHHIAGEAKGEDGDESVHTGLQAGSTWVLSQAIAESL